MKPRSRQAFTLVELMITVVIVLVVFLAMISGMIYNACAQKMAREQTQAHQQAAILIEDARRLFFVNLVPVTKAVVIDNNRTPANPKDDLRGQARLRLFRLSDRVEIASAKNEDLIIVLAEVEWTSMGRHRRITKIAHFAP